METTFVAVARDALLNNLLTPFLPGGTDLYQWRTAVVMERILRDRPARWLPSKFHSYDEMLIASADQAASAIEASTHSPHAGRRA